MAHNETSVTTLRDILSMSLEKRHNLYDVTNVVSSENGIQISKNIQKVKIDNKTFTDYSAFSYIMEKSYLKSPVRSSRGSIDNLDSYAWFLTPHLKIDFSLMSIDSYRVLMKLIRTKNEFTVTCYDVVEDRDVTHHMYFATEQMPKLWNIARAINGEELVELIGVQDYTVEMIGTNTDVKTINVTYKLNKPSDATWNGETSASEEIVANHTLNVGITMSNGTQQQDVTTITFNNTYKFKYWCDFPSGQGFRYVDGNEYMFSNTTTLYAIWEKGASE